MKLFGYWRSGAAWRLRIAMKMKGLEWEDAPVNLLTGAQRGAEYLAKNPIGLVPALELEDGTVLTQSLAILDWLERTYPKPPLLPTDPVSRARVLAAGMVIAVDTHPIQNVGVVNHLKTAFAADQEGGVAWMIHWMARGFSAFQEMCWPDTAFAFGPEPGYADICLIPQLYNARRWGMNLTEYSRLTEIEAQCMALPAFFEAQPERQPDATD